MKLLATDALRDHLRELAKRQGATFLPGIVRFATREQDPARLFIPCPVCPDRTVVLIAGPARAVVTVIAGTAREKREFDFALASGRCTRCMTLYLKAVAGKLSGDPILVPLEFRA